MQINVLQRFERGLLGLALAASLTACAPTVTEDQAAGPPSEGAVGQAAGDEAPGEGEGEDAPEEVPRFEAGAVDHGSFVEPAIRAEDIPPLGEERPLRIVATVGQITDIVERIGGERVTLEQIVPGADDPHVYVPSSRDVVHFSEADLIFYNGLFLEGQMDRTFRQMRELGIPTVAVSAGLEDDMLLEREYEPGSYVTDPHIWFDPLIWKRAAANVTLALSARDPAGAPQYEAALAELEVEMEALLQWCRDEVAALPAERRLLITSHDAFGYLGRRFGLEVVGLQGLSAEAEAGIRDVENLVQLIIEREVPAVFVEASVSPEALEAVAEAVRAGGNELRIGGELFSDTPGQRGTPQGSYPGMVIWNVATIAAAMGADSGSALPPTLAEYSGYDLEGLLREARERVAEEMDG